MSLSIKSSKSKKSSSTSQSNHNPATPETVTTVADPVVAPVPLPSSIDALAQKAIADMDALESMLKLDIVMASNDKYQVGAANRVSDTAIGLASDIVSAAPERFPDFADLPAAASYVQVITQVASRASELAMHVQKSVQNQRTPAATKTLALYQVVRSLGRIEGNETMREKVTALKAEVAPKRRNPKPKVTKAEKAARNVAKSTAKKVTKALEMLKAAGYSLPATASTDGSASASSDASATPAANAHTTPVVSANASATPVTNATSNGAAAAPSNGAASANGAAAASN